MATCPSCKAQHKSRKDGCCPTCGEPVTIYEGQWILEGDIHPPVKILNAIDLWISKRMSTIAGSQVVYKSPRKGERFRNNLGRCKDLWAAADYDADLAIEAVDILNTSPVFNGTVFNTIALIQYHWDQAVSLARATREQKKLNAQAESKAWDKIDKRDWL